MFITTYWDDKSLAFLSKRDIVYQSKEETWNIYSEGDSVPDDYYRDRNDYKTYIYLVRGR